MTGELGLEKSHVRDCRRIRAAVVKRRGVSSGRGSGRAVYREALQPRRASYRLVLPLLNCVVVPVVRVMPTGRGLMG